ncbi:MAG: hypothetical protein ACXVAY_19585 [Mucilaginibacter sp.]
MLTQQDLIKQITATIGKAKVVELSKILREQKFALHDLIDLTFYPDKNIAFRSAWLLENVFLTNPETYLDHLDYLLKRLPEVNYPSCQRHYAKIMMHITVPNAPAAIKSKLQGTAMESIIEKLFDWLIDPNVKIAVKVFASEALLNLSVHCEWIAEELKNQILFLMKNGTAAIQSRGKKILKTIKT